MSLSFDNHTVGGLVSGDVLFGYKPLEWMMFTVTRAAALWDTYGNRARLRMNYRVLVQGKANVASLRERIRGGVEVLVSGQDAPAHATAADSQVRGHVILASIIQFPDKNTQKEES